MGQQIFKSDEYRQAVSTLSSEELSLIKKQFMHLASRSMQDNDNVDKDTFLRFIPLPGMLGERLFSVCDRDRDNTIDFEDFVTSMALLTRGSKEDQYKLIFQMCDVAGDGRVSSEELEMMINSIRDTNHSPPPIEDIPNVEELDDDEAQALAHKIEGEIHDINVKLEQPNIDSNTMLSLMEQKYQKERMLAKMGRDILDEYRAHGETLQMTVKKIAEGAVRSLDSDHSGSLNYKQFRSWAAQNPFVFDSVFESDSIQELRHRLEARPSLRSIDTSRPPPKGVMYGYLLKGKDKDRTKRPTDRRFYLLQDHFLYEFKNEKAAQSEDTLPRKAIFLPGCHIYGQTHPSRPESPSDDLLTRAMSPTASLSRTTSRASRSTSRTSARDRDRARSKSRERVGTTNVDQLNQRAQSPEPLVRPGHSQRSRSIDRLNKRGTSPEPLALGSARHERTGTASEAAAAISPTAPPMARAMSSLALKDKEAEFENNHRTSPPDNTVSRRLNSTPSTTSNSDETTARRQLTRASTQPAPQHFDDAHGHKNSTRHKESNGRGSVAALFGLGNHHDDSDEQINKPSWSFKTDNSPQPPGAASKDGVEFVALTKDGEEQSESSDEPDHHLYELEILYNNHDIFLYAEDFVSYERWFKALEEAAENRHIEDYYDIDYQKQLGTGYFADVYLCRSNGRDGITEPEERFACKIIYKEEMSEAQTEMFRTEIACLNLVRHPNIVSVLNIFDTTEKMFIVMELLEGGSVLSRLERDGYFKHDEGRDIMKQVCAGICYLHDVGIVHRDLKPGNLVFSSEREDAVLKIVDFGLSTFAASTDPFSKPVGTLKYFAPELILHKPYNRAVDMWCVGVVAYIVMTSQFPFEARSQQDLLNNIAAARFNTTSDNWRTLPDLARDFIRRLLVVDPEKRMTSDEAVLHPWITGVVAKSSSTSPPLLSPSATPTRAATPPSKPKIQRKTSVDQLQDKR